MASRNRCRLSACAQYGAPRLGHSRLLLLPHCDSAARRLAHQVWRGVPRRPRARRDNACVSTDENPATRRILAAHHAIAAVAGHDLPSPLKEELDAASLAVGEPDSEAPIGHLAPREGKPDWRGRLGRRRGHALEGLAVAHYHYTRTLEIERDITTMLRSLETPLPSSTMGFASRKLNAEYQAFVFALRRSMEYFAAAMGAFFKTDCRRIRDLEGAIVGREPLERSEKTIEIVLATLAGLPYLLTDQAQQKDVRTRPSGSQRIRLGGHVQRGMGHRRRTDRRDHWRRRRASGLQ